MDVELHSINREYNFDSFTLGENEDLVFFVKEGEDLTRFYASSYCRDRGSGTYKLEVTAENIEQIEMQTTEGTPLDYVMTPRFTFTSTFSSDETHDDWMSYMVMQGKMAGDHHIRSSMGFHLDVMDRYVERMNNASGPEMRQVLKDIIADDKAFISSATEYVKYWEGNHPDAIIYMGIVEKE